MSEATFNVNGGYNAIQVRCESGDVRGSVSAGMKLAVFRRFEIPVFFGI
jgi:hypothetical protein